MTHTTAVSAAVSTVSRAALCALLGLCLLAGLLPHAGASTALPTFTVTRTADDTNSGSLRSAIMLASVTPGSTVNFQIPATDPGVSGGTATITLSLGPLVVASSLNIVGPNMPSGAVVVNGAAQSRVFSVTAGTVSFSNLTITNGYANPGSLAFPEPEGGGGILNMATLTLTNCTVTGNVSSGNGGGIVNSGTFTASSACVIGGNTAGSDGGGLFNTGMATLNGALLANNSVQSSSTGTGGGGAFNSGTLVVNGGQVTGNSSFNEGGGIDNGSGGTLTLNACTFAGNNAIRSPNGTGGAINNFGSAQITNCLVVNNAGFNVGGLNNGGALTLINSTFAGNTTGGSSFNDFSQRAGGLLSGPATVTNDIFYFDTSNANGPAVPSEIVAASGTTGPTVTYSDVQGGYSGTGNINADPQFVRNPSLGTFGAPNDNGDEHLLLTSPAVHTGTNGPGVPLTDIEGTPRPTPPARPSMGAFEVSGSSGGFSAQGGFTVTGTQNQSTGTQVVAKFLPGTTAASSFTATVDFGDGSGPMPATITADPATAGVLDVTASHTYATYGTFTVTVVISGPGGTPTATVTSTATIQPAQIATNVTGQVSVNRGGFYYNRFTRRYSQTVTITNIGTTAIPGPISLALDNLTSGVTAVNAAGTTQFATPAGSPYFTVQAGSLAPGATTSLLLQLTYTGSSQIDYAPRVLAGPGAR